LTTVLLKVIFFNTYLINYIIFNPDNKEITERLGISQMGHKMEMKVEFDV